jgi:DNA polymerase I-like protein with 3'-5' exonuclease and polymerase domains
MSLEAVELSQVDAPTESPKPAPKPRRTKEEAQADRELKAAERAAAKVLRAAERERLKQERAEARLAEAVALKQAKLDAAEGGRIELPAVVFRTGVPTSISPVDAVAVIQIYLENLCLDCETSGYWIGHKHYELRTVQLGGEEAAVVLDAADPDQMAIASWALKAAKKLWAHSATADAIPCVNAGLIEWDEIWAKMYDSVIRAKLTDPAACGSEADKLKDLARDLLREYAVSPDAEKAKDALFAAMKTVKSGDSTTRPETLGWYQVSKFAVTMVRYAGSDVLDLAAVLRVLPPLPVSEAVFERECQVQAICARSAYEGAPLDLLHIQEKIAEYEAEQQEAQTVVEKLTEGRITNPSSSKDVLEYLTEKGYPLSTDRKTGAVTAGKASLEPIAKRGDELAKAIVGYRHCVTTLGLLLRPLESLCLNGDGVMRPTIYTINARTGRMSAVRPNSQQFSRQGGIRSCVRAPEGYRGISADFSGCEILVSAALSGDKALYDAETGPRCHRCLTDADEAKNCLCGPGKAHQGLHWLTAHTAYGEGAAKEDRYNAKRGTFTKLFGGGPPTAAEQVGCEVSVMEKLFEAFSVVAPTFSQWDRWLRQCFDEGSMVWRDYTTGTNYRQDIPGSRHLIYRAYSGRNIYVTKGPHAAGNGAIQGTARELLVDGLIKRKQTRWGNSVVLPVHDELISFVKAEEAEAATEELVACMETSVLSSPGLPILISVDHDDPWTSWPDSS